MNDVVSKMRGIIVSRSYVKLVDDGNEFYIGSKWWDDLQKALRQAKIMRKFHKGGIKTIILEDKE